MLASSIIALMSDGMINMPNKTQKLGGFLQKHGFTNLKIKSSFLEADWKPQDSDKSAAWCLYVEMITRITTQPLEGGNEKTALDSIVSLFAITREILKKYEGCAEFSKIAIIVLNQVIRPFTDKWHILSLRGAFQRPDECKEFRSELEKLQKNLRNYTKMLADMADVEDITSLEDL